jgi:hypothetical protein
MQQEHRPAGVAEHVGGEPVAGGAGKRLVQ